MLCYAYKSHDTHLLNIFFYLEEDRVCIDAVRTLHTPFVPCTPRPWTNLTTPKVPENKSTNCWTNANKCPMVFGSFKNCPPNPSTSSSASYGELCSVRIMAARLNQIGVPAQAFDTWEVGILTDSRFGDAKLVEGYKQRVEAAFDRIDPNVVAVVTGCVGHVPHGKITTLGRGG
jgi:hypothetical protein